MPKLFPLLIGMPFTYKLVDFELLKNNDIEPTLAYFEGTETVGKEKSVYYNSLCIDEIAKIIENNRVDAIVCFNDNFLIEAAKLRTKYNIPGINYPSIEKYKVKSAMYKLLSPYMMVPKTLDYHEDLAYEDIIESIGYCEYFIKPDNLAGAEGGYHIKNKNDFIVWKSTYFDSKIKYILQKFYPEPLFHCELIIKNGAVKYIQARRYSYPNHMFLNGKIIASFPIVDLSLEKKIEQASIKVQQLLEYKNGVMHTEFFLDDYQEPIFLETNIRQAGGAINLIHRRRTGISLETAMVLLELDKDITIKPNNKEVYDFCGYIPLKKGKVSQICLPKLKGQYNFDFRVHIGGYYDTPKSASNTAASFVGYSSVYSDLIDDFFSLENNDIIKYD
ncbi:TPA: acetyl-CoA carboxylase biotin carboxylase subunit family protein [Legionella anisa]